MAITSAICNSFKVEILTGTHNFTASSGNSFKIALVSATPVLSTDTAVCDFAQTTWSSATFTTRGCIIYNSSASNKAVMVLDFGADYSVSNGTFAIDFPTPNASNAIIRIS